MTKIINGLLFIALLVGAVLAFRADAERRELQVEFDRLSADHGHLAIADENKIHIVALETEDPMHFRWRVYLPANQAYTWKHRNGSNSGSADKEPKDFMTQVRLRYDEPKKALMTFYSHNSGSGSSTAFHDKAGRFIADHWDQMEFQVAGKEGIEAYDLGNTIDLVRIKMPDDLFAEFKEKFPREAKYRGSTVYYRTVGTKEAWEAAEKAAAEGRQSE